MQVGEEIQIADLVLRVFDEFVAPGFSDEGIAEFRKFVDTEAMAKRHDEGDIFLVAELDRNIVGMIAMRDTRHIALLFVEKAYQRKGIARRLVQQGAATCRKHNPTLSKITVNASPNAVSAYEHIGFRAVAEEQEKNGIRFIPMELTGNRL